MFLINIYYLIYKYFYCEIKDALAFQRSYYGNRLTIFK